MAIKLIQMTGEEFMEKVMAGERDLNRIQLDEGFGFSEHPDFTTFQEYAKAQPWDTDTVENLLEIKRSEFKGADMTGIWLPSVVAIGADFSGATLIGANLKGANFGKARFQDAYLNDAVLDRAWLTELAAQGADMQGASLIEVASCNADFQLANLERANLQGAHLTDANFKRANLYKANLQRADLQRADLYEADAQEADFRRADVKGTNFFRTELGGADLRGVVNLGLGQNLLGHAHYYNTKVTEAEKAIIDKARAEVSLYDVKEEVGID